VGQALYPEELVARYVEAYVRDRWYRIAATGEVWGELIERALGVHQGERPFRPLTRASIDGEVVVESELRGRAYEAGASGSGAPCRYRLWVGGAFETSRACVGLRDAFTAFYALYIESGLGAAPLAALARASRWAGFEGFAGAIEEAVEFFEAAAPLVVEAVEGAGDAPPPLLPAALPFYTMAGRSLERLAARGAPAEEVERIVEEMERRAAERRWAMARLARVYTAARVFAELAASLNLVGP